MLLCLSCDRLGVVVWLSSLFAMLKFVNWCRRGDSNPHELPHTPLKRARLPVPPLRHEVRLEGCGHYSRNRFQEKLRQTICSPPGKLRALRVKPQVPLVKLAAQESALLRARFRVVIAAPIAS